MAKDLPYFKFVVSEWNDGDVTLCSMEAQGLFINLCSLYWSQEGVLSLTKCKKRYYKCDTTVFDELIKEGVIKVENDNIFISFLDEQFKDRQKLSKTNSKNVSKRWKKEDIDTTVIRPDNVGTEFVYNIEERREEKKREEERRKEEKRIKPLRAYDVPFVNGCLKAWEAWEQHRIEIKKKLTPSTAKQQIKMLGGRPDSEIIAMINQSITNGWTGIFELKTNNYNNVARKGNQRTSDAIITPGSEFGKF